MKTIINLLLLVLMFSCNKSAVVEPVKTVNKAKARVIADDFQGQWQFAYMTTSQAPYNSWNYQQNHSCSLNDVWLFIGRNNNAETNSGYVTITNRLPECGTPNVNGMSNENDYQFITWQKIVSQNEQISWSAFDQGITVTRNWPNGNPTSSGLGHYYNVTFSDDKQTMFWNWPTYRTVIWVRNTGGPSVP